jgi:CRISPR-associated endonuclease/helicase Cas3
MKLTAEHFPDFYQELHGYGPFPWQTRLVRELVNQRAGCWPGLDLPTSSGKTSVLDIAVFLLALEGGRPIAERRAALRTFFVVDRRIVVDEAKEHAEKIAKKLNDVGPHSPEILRAVADRLHLFGGKKALHISIMRGGMYRDGSWAEAPNQPTICLSTVDQVGSRLLFRGYGVSPYQRAVHAGLVGNDSLIILDEAHLSQPFRQTLQAVNRYRGKDWAERSLNTPFQVVFMSATVPHDTVPFRLDHEDYENELLSRRLNANKRARLEEVKEGEDEESIRKAFVKRAMDCALELAGLKSVPEPKKGKRSAKQDTPAQPVQVIGIVVNRVETARRIFMRLEEERDKANPTYDVILLTGRIRPYDRDRMLGQWMAVMAAQEGRVPPPNGKLFVVATQTIEVGANLDFDALVTEAAPLDALRQRFGRLNRLGRPIMARAVILACKKSKDWKDDPVYGPTMKEAWEWLNENASGTKKERQFDFGINHAKFPTDAELLAKCNAQTVNAPVMMPAHLDTWVQTSVLPTPDPDVALFLHGPSSGPADVQIVWRADLTEDLLRRHFTTAIQVVNLVPPTSMEALPVPIWAAKAWLRQSAFMEIADIEGVDLEGEEFPRRPARGFAKPFLRWQGPEDSEVSRAIDDIQPGDTIVVPAVYGGSDAFGWIPTSADAVKDVADECVQEVRGQPVLRIDPQRIVVRTRFPESVFLQELEAIINAPDSEEPDWRQLKTISEVPKPLDWLKENGVRFVSYPDQAGQGVVVLGKQRKDKDYETEAPPTDDTASLTETETEITLSEHCCGVRDQVKEFVERLGLPQDLREVLQRAALLHDAGKADPRFQLWLHGADEAKWANASEALAKSARNNGSRAAVFWSRRRSGWPCGARHEALSVLFARETPAAQAGIANSDLLLYLIGTHHGRGRPFWPVIDDDPRGNSAAPCELPQQLVCKIDAFTLQASPQTRPEQAFFELSYGWIELFWQHIRTYGPWGLAYLETLLVLADHQRSNTEGQS